MNAADVSNCGWTTILALAPSQETVGPSVHALRFEASDGSYPLAQSLHSLQTPGNACR